MHSINALNIFVCKSNCTNLFNNYCMTHCTEVNYEHNTDSFNIYNEFITNNLIFIVPIVIFTMLLCCSCKCCIYQSDYEKCEEYYKNDYKDCKKMV